MNCAVRIDVPENMQIGEVASSLWEMACELNVNVVGKFRGVDVYARPEDTPNDCIKRLHRVVDEIERQAKKLRGGCHRIG